MNTPTPVQDSSVTVVRWAAIIVGVLSALPAAFMVVFILGMTWGLPSPTNIIPFVVLVIDIVGLVLAIVWKGVGEGVGGALLVLPALAIVFTVMWIPLEGMASNAGFAVAGAGFLYCWWRRVGEHWWLTRREHSQHVA